jgi:hypothetical protein
MWTTVTGGNDINYNGSISVTPTGYALASNDLVTVSANNSSNPGYFFINNLNNIGVNAGTPTTLTSEWAITNSGNATFATVSTSSDVRLKQDIIPLELDNFSIDNLNPVYFKFKKTNKESIGLIAHELQKFIPCLVEGDMYGQQTQTVNYSGLIAILIKEIQVLKNRVLQLEKN